MDADFKLDKKRQFRFTQSSGRAFEQAYGDSLLNALNKMGPNVTNFMTWAAVRHLFQNKLTHEHTDVLIQKFIDKGGDAQDLIKFLCDGWTKSGVIGRPDEEAASLEVLEAEVEADPESGPKD